MKIDGISIQVPIVPESVHSRSTVVQTATARAISPESDSDDVGTRQKEGKKEEEKENSEHTHEHTLFASNASVRTSLIVNDHSKVNIVA